MALHAEVQQLRERGKGGVQYLLHVTQAYKRGRHSNAHIARPHRPVPLGAIDDDRVTRPEGSVVQPTRAPDRPVPARIRSHEVGLQRVGSSIPYLVEQVVARVEVALV